MVNLHPERKRTGIVCVDARCVFVGGDKRCGEHQWRPGHREHRADGHLY